MEPEIIIGALAIFVNGGAMGAAGIVFASGSWARCRLRHKSACNSGIRGTWRP
jgi:hypothetical protein